jgi:formylglycine-generating enzyme
MARSAQLCAALALIFTVGACEKLIGIEDTNVVVEDGVAGKAPLDDAGASNAGESSAGAAGKVGTAGSANGGSANGGSAGKGGAEAGGASAGTGGSACNCAAGDLQCNLQCTAGGCNCKAPTPVCENGTCVARGPTQMQAGSKSGGTLFYIDSTEVTNEQYAAFLTAKGADTSGQRPECNWNKSYQPAEAIGDDKRPAVNVDFCDAAAFCDWAGERLCGDLSGGPLAITSPNLTDPTKSQWYLACAGPDSTAYPYGNDFKAGYCNEYPGSGQMANAGASTMCNGHYPGVFDLVGNAAEWIDSCVDDPGGDHSMDTCELMGGSFLNEDYDCSTKFNSTRMDSAAVFGFRCCSK